ncbi:MAG TPA: RNase adapter RapZ [Ruminococcaceae bacterium]|nr:RNase adapter RapZ [Oscillospiraceae bacterium]
MQLVIVTGMSGAGKSRAVEALEDIGFYCVDNMPPKLIPTFIQLCVDSKRERVALVADIRLGSEFTELFDILSDIKDVKYRILFIDADNEVIMRRYQETRRKHPLADEFNTSSILAAIEKERETLLDARQKADYIVDTSEIMSSQFKEKIVKLFLKNVASSLKIYSNSFGFKYGIPKEADLVFDVRCLPNPFYVPELKNHTGIEEPVRTFVMKFRQAKQLEKKLYDLIDFLVPLYMSEGKSQLTIAFGCTGGKHRSVVFAELLNKHLLEKGADVTVFHRDITR